MQQKYIDLLERLDDFFKELEGPTEDNSCCQECEPMIDSISRTTLKNAKNIEQLEINVGSLKSDSHPPIFSKNDYKDLIKRIKKLENGKK